LSEYSAFYDSEPVLKQFMSCDKLNVRDSNVGLYFWISGQSCWTKNRNQHFVNVQDDGFSVSYSYDALKACHSITSALLLIIRQW